MDVIEEYLTKNAANQNFRRLSHMLIQCRDGCSSALLLGGIVPIPFEDIVPFGMCQQCKEYPNCKSMQNLLKEIEGLPLPKELKKE